MPAPKSKQKAIRNGELATLRDRCWRNGMSVSQLARRIGRNRSTVYFAWADPEKFPLASKLIREALSK